jgi:hypothetical protein
MARPKGDRVSRLEEELDKDAVCHHFYSIYIVNMLPRKLLKAQFLKPVTGITR